MGCVRIPAAWRLRSELVGACRLGACYLPGLFGFGEVFVGFGVPYCWLLGWEDMSLGKILLFYKFTPIADPQAMRLWQRDLCELLGLTGRILISEHGING